MGQTYSAPSLTLSDLTHGHSVRRMSSYCCFRWICKGVESTVVSERVPTLLKMGADPTASPMVTRVSSLPHKHDEAFIC